MKSKYTRLYPGQIWRIPGESAIYMHGLSATGGARKKPLWTVADAEGTTWLEGRIALPRRLAKAGATLCEVGVFDITGKSVVSVTAPCKYCNFPSNRHWRIQGVYTVEAGGVSFTTKTVAI